MSSSSQYYNFTKTSVSAPDIKAANSNIDEPVFVCTICWQNQPSGSKPKLLGTSARIVCHACWCAVLDLSICWVCGECIVRGDDVVSLGWCFWHRVCFGCLFCKTKMSVPPTEKFENGTNRRTGSSLDGSEDCDRTVTGDIVRRCLGVELEEVPLCGVCKVEAASDPPKLVHEKGLEAVTRTDGGLSRDRLDMLDGRVQRRDASSQITTLSAFAPRRSKGFHTQEVEDDLRRYINSSSNESTHSNPAKTPQRLLNKRLQSLDGFQDDGEASSIANSNQILAEGDVLDATIERHTHSDDEKVELGHIRPDTPSREELSDEIYLSIFNPLGEPAFKTSKTKPLPQWMRLLPSNFQRERENKITLPLRAKSYESLRSTQELSRVLQNSPIAVSSMVDPFDDMVFSSQLATAISSPVSELAETTSSPRATYLMPSKLNPIMTHDQSSVDARILQPEGILSSESSESFYSSSSEETVFEASPKPARTKTPYPRMSRPVLSHAETNAYFNHCIVVDPKTVHESLDLYEHDMPPTPPLSPRRFSITPQQIAQWRLPDPLTAGPSSISHSSEYLGRYQPLDAKAQQHAKYAPKESEPILEKIRRQRNEKRMSLHGVGAVGEQNFVGRRKVNALKRMLDRERRISRVEGIDSRGNLHRELKDLFRED